MKTSKFKVIRIVFILFAGLVMIGSCKKDVTITPQPNKIEPGVGAGNEVLTLTGSDLRSIASIVFDNGNVSAPFNTNLNTDNAVIFRVPTDANVGEQHIVFTNTNGYQFSVPFTVLAVPSIISAFPAEWEAGGNITITGNYLETVDHVALEGTSDTAEIISTSPTTLVIKMPASEAVSPKLIFHNNAGSTTSSFVFLNLDKQQKFFTEDFASGMQNWSWCAAAASTDFAVSGVKSLKASYAADAFQGLSFHYDFNITANDYQYLSFWVKGGTDDNQVDVKTDDIKSGTAGSKTIDVPFDVWTHVTIPISGNYGGSVFTRFNFQIKGPVGKSQDLYFDNVVLVK